MPNAKDVSKGGGADGVRPPTPTDVRPPRAYGPRGPTTTFARWPRPRGEGLLELTSAEA